MAKRGFPQGGGGVDPVMSSAEHCFSTRYCERISLQPYLVLSPQVTTSNGVDTYFDWYILGPTYEYWIH